MSNSVDTTETPTEGDDHPTSEETNTTPTRRDVLVTMGSVASTSALAGCPGQLTSQKFEATPVVLTPPGQEALGLPEFELKETTETRSLSDVGEVTVTSYLSVHNRPAEGDPPHRFDETDPRFRRVGALSTPSPDVVGGAVNPFASDPLGELVAGDRGRQLLQQTGILDTADFQWRAPPRRIGTADVQVIDTGTQAQRYMGIAVESDGAATTLVMDLARITYEGDAIIAGEFVRRTTPPNPIDSDVGCVDDLCQLPSPRQVDMWRRYKRAVNYLATCTEITTQGATIEVCGGGGGGGGPGTASPTPTPQPTFGITNARLVQQVESTVVKAPNSSPIHTEPDPDLVAGEHTAVVFELDQIQNVDALGGPLELEIVHGPSGNKQTERFEISQSDLKRIKSGVSPVTAGEHTISVLHNNGPDGGSGSANDLPVFELSANPGVEIRTVNASGGGFQQVVMPASGQSVVDLDTLAVGFIALTDGQNGSRYGNSNGDVQNFTRSFRSAYEYLRRSYPGDVVGYAHRSHRVVGKANLFGHSRQVFKDMKRGNRELNRIAADPSYPNSGAGFPNGGILETDGLNRSNIESHIKNTGFDVVVVIVPGNDPSNSGATGYYDYHNKDASGLAWANPAAAVSARGASASGNDVGISSTTAQEVGHYFQNGYKDPSGHPMAQRRNKKATPQQRVNGKQIDPSHARHQNSSLRGISSDPPGVVSTAYDLEGGFANLQSYQNPNGSFGATGPSDGSTAIGQVQSFMSYTGNDDEVWSDARIHQQMIDNEWNPPGLFGGGDTAYMVSGTGTADETGEIQYDEVVSFSGVNRYPDIDGASVKVELLGPSGEVFETARVPFRVESTHQEADADGPIEAPAFTLPFAERGVEIRTSYEGTLASMNPIERSVRDAVSNVPDRGFSGDPEAARATIREALDRVAASMANGAYGEAAQTMDGPVRTRIQDRVVGYESHLGEPTLEGLLDLVDEMVRRLQTVAETTG